MADVKCIHCGYDLRGSPEMGSCSECGLPVVVTLRQQGRKPWWRRVRWRKIVLAIAVLTAVVSVPLGLVPLRENLICTECGRHATRQSNGWGFPPGFVLVQTRGTETIGGPRDSLSPYLDPDGTCSHNWLPISSTSHGFLWKTRSCLIDPTSNTVATELEFAQFVKENPDVIGRIRASLRGRDSVRGWLGDEFLAWRDRTETVTH